MKDSPNDKTSLARQAAAREVSGSNPSRGDVFLQIIKNSILCKTKRSIAQIYIDLGSSVDKGVDSCAYGMGSNPS